VGACGPHTFRMIGLSVGIAAMGAIVSGAGLGMSGVSKGFLHGLSVALLVNAGFAVASVLVALVMVGPPPAAQAPEEGAAAPSTVRSNRE
jgi:hypothetical protein